MIYYITLTVLFMLGFYNMYSDNKKVITQLYIGCLCLLVLHDGLRWVIGTDWDNYYRFFRNCLVTNTDDVYFEYAYVQFNKIVRTLTDQYSVFLVLHALIVYTLIGVTIRKLAIYPILSLALMYALMLGYVGMNRQYIALAIQIFSLQFVVKRQLYPFIACLVVATFFHNSSLIFLPVYFLTKPANRLVYIIIIAVLLLVALSGIIRRLPLELFYVLGSDVGDKADKYVYEGADAVSIFSQLLGISKRLIWIVLPLIYFKGFKEVKNFPLFYNVYFMSFCVYLLFNNTVLQFIISRGLLSFNLFEVFILPMILFIFKNNITRKIIYVLMFAYALMLINKAFDSYVQTLGYDIFNPYRCILFE